MRVLYFNIFTHYVFTTLNRKPVIKEKHRERIEKYITGVVNHSECKLYAIYANPEHVHVLASRSPWVSEEALANIIAESTQKFILKNELADFRFAWQDSAAAFSVSKGDVDKVCKYILNQKEHHKKVTFAEEYDAFMNFYLEPIQPRGQ